MGLLDLQRNQWISPWEYGPNVAHHVETAWFSKKLKENAKQVKNIEVSLSGAMNK